MNPILLYGYNLPKDQTELLLSFYSNQYAK